METRYGWMNLIMTESLDIARASVTEMVASQQVPSELVGDLDLQTLITTVTSMVEEGIKEHLDLAAATEEEAAQKIQEAMEQIAMRVALVFTLATLSEMPGTSDESVQVPLSADQVSSVLTTLLQGGAISVQLSVE